MDQNTGLVHNQQSHSIWQSWFNNRPVKLSLTENVTGRPRRLPIIQHQQNADSIGLRVNSRRPNNIRVNLLRLDSQGEDNNSCPPILLSSNNFYQHKTNTRPRARPISSYATRSTADIGLIVGMNKDYSTNFASNTCFDNDGVTTTSSSRSTISASLKEAVVKHLSNILHKTPNYSTINESKDSNFCQGRVQQLGCEQAETSVATKSVQLFTSRENYMQVETELTTTTSSHPIRKTLPYFRPLVPIVGLSASTLLLARYRQRTMDRNNLTLTSQTKCTLNEFKKHDNHSIYSSFLLAKLELATLMQARQQLESQQLPQIHEIMTSALENVSSKEKLDKNMQTPHFEEIGNKASLRTLILDIPQPDIEMPTNFTSEFYLESDSTLDPNIAEPNSVFINHSCNNIDKVNKSTVLGEDCQDGQSSDDSSYYFSSHSELGDKIRNDDDNDTKDAENETDSINDDYSNESLSDCESDTEFYNASSECDSDSDFDSDTESWSSDLKPLIPTCGNSIISFILGQCDEAACNKDSGFVDGDETALKVADPDGPSEDHLWQSLMASKDPYNPINGWKCIANSLCMSSSADQTHDLTTSTTTSTTVTPTKLSKPCESIHTTEKDCLEAVSVSNSKEKITKQNLSYEATKEKTNISKLSGYEIRSKFCPIGIINNILTRDTVDHALLNTVKDKSQDCNDVLKTCLTSRSRVPSKQPKKKKVPTATLR